MDAETADIGTELSRCVRCAMPPDVESIVNQIVGTADAILDELARRLAVSADDLLIRAQVATDDSLAMASSAPLAVGATFGGVVMPMAGSYGTPIDTPFGGGGLMPTGGSYGTPVAANLGSGWSGGAIASSESSLPGVSWQSGGAFDSASSSSATTFASAPAWWSGASRGPAVANDPRTQQFLFGPGRPIGADVDGGGPGRSTTSRGRSVGRCRWRSSRRWVRVASTVGWARRRIRSR